MLINQEKTTIETNESLEGYWLINENTESGKLLAQKIRENNPHFDFVLDETGNLIDIIPTDRPPKPMQPPTQEERIEALELVMIDLLS